MKARNLYRLLAALILAGVALQRAVTMHRPESMVRNHAHIREVAKLVPNHIGPWVGEDVPVQVQALTVLRPNVIVSRRYLNIETGRTAGVVLVHCSDAHAMAGHFPLRCYPARGWDLQSSRSHEWAVEGLAPLTGMEYTFSLTDNHVGGREVQSIAVANCLFRPGKVLPDMDAMVKSVIGAGGQSSGAGQLQIYFDAGMPEAERNAAIVALASGYKDLINSILSGDTQ